MMDHAVTLTGMLILSIEISVNCTLKKKKACGFLNGFGLINLVQKALVILFVLVWEKI